jgi:hypothetical protein
MICLIFIIDPILVVMSLLSALPANQRRRPTAPEEPRQSTL